MVDVPLNVQFKNQQLTIIKINNINRNDNRNNLPMSPRKKICRNLFGSPKPGEVDNLYKKEQKEKIDEFKEKYHFDPRILFLDRNGNEDENENENEKNSLQSSKNNEKKMCNNENIFCGNNSIKDSTDTDGRISKNRETDLNNEPSSPIRETVLPHEHAANSLALTTTPSSLSSTLSGAILCTPLGH